MPPSPPPACPMGRHHHVSAVPCRTSTLHQKKRCSFKGTLSPAFTLPNVWAVMIRGAVTFMMSLMIFPKSFFTVGGMNLVTSPANPCIEKHELDVPLSLTPMGHPSEPHLTHECNVPSSQVKGQGLTFWNIPEHPDSLWSMVILPHMSMCH